MAHSQTNNVLVYLRMYAVTERGVVGRQVDCSILWLQRLQSSYCPEWSQETQVDWPWLYMTIDALQRQ